MSWCARLFGLFSRHYLKGIREWDMDKSTLFTPCLEAQARFQAQIDLQKLQEYAQRYKPADYKED